MLYPSCIQMSESESEEIPMYCCLTFSYAVKYDFIKIDTHRVEVGIFLRSSLTNSDENEVWDKLSKHTFQASNQTIFG
jgi:hypothetical protein